MTPEMQLEQIDKALELLREVQNSGQWETLQKAKEELRKAREKMVRGYNQAEQRKNKK